MPHPIITLTTDFGTRDPYVAAMKGVILGIHPAVRLIDVSHDIAPQGVREAALCLADITPYFPRETIHLVVVDPGVGSARRLLCIRMHDQYFVGPDNGVLSWAARGAMDQVTVELAESNYWLTRVSATFHGRDVLAPVAAHISRGVPIESLGPRISQWIRLPWPEPVRAAHGITGEVIAVDRFGNLVTAITDSDLDPSLVPMARVMCAGTVIGPIARTYCDVGDGELVALIGSRSRLEVAVRNGSAARALDVAVGAEVRVFWA